MDEWDDADQIDVDDSDLPSLLSLPRFSTPAKNKSARNNDNPTRSHFLHRCTLSQSGLLGSNSTPLASPPRFRDPEPEPEPAGSPRPPAAPSRVRRIPGPAGEVQARMQREIAAAECPAQCEIGGNKATDGNGEGSGSARAADEEFETEAWVSAMDFLVGRGGGRSRYCPISSIKAATDKGAYRVDQVVGIVSSCKPNGLGSLYATLKDPTGTIGAFVHSKALESNRFRDLAVGCVLVLKQVVVFHIRSVSYLNVTVNNVTKLIGNEVGLSQRIITQSYTGRNTPAPGKCTDTAYGSEVRMRAGVKSAKVVAHHHNHESERASLEAVDRLAGNQASLDKSLRNGKSRRLAVDECVQGSALYQGGIDSNANPAAVSGISSRNGLEVTTTSVTTPLMPVASAKISNPGFEALCSAENVVNSYCGSMGSTVRSAASIASGLQRSQPLPKRNTAAAPSGTEKPDSEKEMGVSGVKSCPNAMQEATVAYPPVVLTMAEPVVIHGVNPKADKLVMNGDGPDWTDDQLAELFCDYPDADDMAINFGI